MGESSEVQAIRRFMVDAGIPHRVTSTTGGKHAKGSRHYRPGTAGGGLAADFAGKLSFAADADVAQMQMLPIYQALLLVAPQLHELIFNAPGVKWCVKNGRKVDGFQAFGKTTMLGHENHVHVSVDKGVFLRWPGVVQAPPPSAPARPAPEPAPQPAVEDDMAEPVDAVAADGGGVRVLTRDGGIRCYKGAAFWGGILNLKPENRPGNPTYTGLVAAPGDGYTIVTADPADADYTFNEDVWNAIQRGEL